MNKYRAFTRLLSFVLVIVMLSIISSASALAQADDPIDTVEATDIKEESIKLNCQFPISQDTTGQAFVYYVELVYSGPAPRVFSFKAIDAPSGWTAWVLKASENLEEVQLELKPDTVEPYAIRVALIPPTYEYPIPGEYHVTLLVSSDTIQKSMDFTAIVTDIYGYRLTPTSGNLFADITKGKENHISLTVANTGTASIANINLISENVPSDWHVSFTPDIITTLDAGSTKEIDMIVKPSSQAKAGDYSITVKANPTEDMLLNTVDLAKLNASPTNIINIRFTVLSSSKLGVIAGIIIVIVIAGVVYLFRRAHIW